ncbi:MAG: hypothetical protein ACOYM8_11030 [Caulobacterales bacterium]
MARPAAVTRQVTTSLVEPVYLRLLAVKVRSRKPLKLLVAEGCALVAAELRLLAQREALLGARAPLGFDPNAALGSFRKVTGDVPEAVYLELMAASHHTRLPLRALAAEGCRRIAEHYYRSIHPQERNA